MKQDILLPIFSGLLLVVLLAGIATVVFLMNAQQVMKPRAGCRGGHVAEVWLEWEICRGSTMYRQRFTTPWQAHLFAKVYAVALDWLLPTHYMDTDWHGRRRAYKHEYAIHFGVRKVVAEEAQDFHPIWSTELPGHSGYRGEHASSHPFERWSGELKGSTADFKV